MSVLWQEWQVWGIITETWKVCVSTFGHLGRIDPHCAAAGLMSTDSPASNEKRAIATVFHQPSARSVQHPIMPWTHGTSSRTAAGVLSHINAGATASGKESAERSSTEVRSWKHCDWVPLGWYFSTHSIRSCDRMSGHPEREIQALFSHCGKRYNITACPLWGRLFPAGKTCLDYIY